MMNPFRRVLPPRRRCETFDMTFGGQNAAFSVTVGFYDDGQLGEVFIDGAKSGSEIAAVTRDGAVLLSLALQYGVPLASIAGAITRDMNGAASSIVGAVVDRLIKMSDAA